MMASREIDQQETYVVREIFCCGEGHCPGIRFTHWESGEVCLMGHSDSATNEDVHLYWRLALTPMYMGNPDKSKDQYAPENGNWYEFASKPENENKWFQVPLAPKGLKEGTEITGRELLGGPALTGVAGAVDISWLKEVASTVNLGAQANEQEHVAEREAGLITDHPEGGVTLTIKGWGLVRSHGWDGDARA